MGRGFRFVGRGIAAAWAFVTWPFRTRAEPAPPRPRRDDDLAARPAPGAQAPGHLGRRLGRDPGRPGAAGHRPQARPGPGRLRHVQEPARDAGQGRDRQGLPRLALARRRRDRRPSDVTAPEVKQAIAELRAEGRRRAGTRSSPSRSRVSQDHTVARLYVPIKGDGHNAEAVASMKALRSSDRAADPQLDRGRRRRRSPARPPAPRTSAR